MKTVLDIVLLLVGFVLLIKGADFLVDGAVGFARRFKVPTLVIGMTIVAFGTSAPEAAVSISAAFVGANEISVANILGSNLFNLLMVGGISAMIRTLPIKPISVTRDYPFHLVITAVLLILFMDVTLGGQSGNMISRGDGLILLLLMGIYIYINIKDGIKSEEAEAEEDVKFSFWKSLLFFLGGLCGIVIGGDLVVDSATGLAQAMGVSDMLIGLTIVAMGTSLPELVTSAVACKKGESDLAWGNIVGSNVFNILFVLGLSATVHPVPITMASIFDTAILLAVAFVIYLATIPQKKIQRPMGIAMVVAYLAYTAYIIIR